MNKYLLGLAASPVLAFTVFGASAAFASGNNWNHHMDDRNDRGGMHCDMSDWGGNWGGDGMWGNWNWMMHRSSDWCDHTSDRNNNDNSDWNDNNSDCSDRHDGNQDGHNGRNGDSHDDGNNWSNDNSDSGD